MKKKVERINLKGPGITWTMVNGYRAIDINRLISIGIADTYYFRPVNGEILSTAKGYLTKLSGTKGYRNSSFDGREFKFGNRRVTRRDIINAYNQRRKIVDFRNGDSITTSTADLFDDCPVDHPRRVDVKEAPILGASNVNWSKSTGAQQPKTHINQSPVKPGNVMIGNVVIIDGAEVVQFSPTPKIHAGNDWGNDWLVEMERLAKKFPDTKFVAVRIAKTAKASGIVWE